MYTVYEYYEGRVRIHEKVFYRLNQEFCWDITSMTIVEVKCPILQFRVFTCIEQVPVCLSDGDQVTVMKYNFSLRQILLTGRVLFLLSLLLLLLLGRPLVHSSIVDDS